MYRLAARVSLLLVLTAVVSCTPTEDSGGAGASGLSGSDAAFVADTAEYFDRLEQLGFAGGLLVARGGETLLHAGYDMADREAGRPWSVKTISTVGSITKQFTGAAILLLQEDGLLSVDDPITEYFPDVPEDKRSITLHQLLTHSSGIVDLYGLDDWDPIDRDTFVRRALEQPLEFDPGSSYAYSNAGYSLLGAILEQLTGASYETFLRERLFLPVGMQDTGYILAGWDNARLAVGYRGDETWGTVLGRPLADDGPFWALRANGGIHSTTADMLLWGRALIRGELLSSQSMQTYWAQHVDEGFGDSHYGYGWVVRQGPGEKRLITHNGGNGILFADMAIFPDDEVVIVLQTNVVADWPVAQSMLETIALRLFEGEAYPRVPKVANVDPAEVTPLTGNYIIGEGARKLVFVVTAEGTELTVTPGTPMTFTLLHSTRAIDMARVSRLSQRIDSIVGAYVKGDDLQPLYDAYRGNASMERLREGWESRKQRLEAEFGALTGYEIVGTALRNGRDVTVARHVFERGHDDSAFVWDPKQEEHLLGRSARGLRPALRFVPTGAFTFGSWDGGFSDSSQLRFAEGGESLTLEDATGNVVAVRTAPEFIEKSE